MRGNVNMAISLGKFLILLGDKLVKIGWWIRPDRDCEWIRPDRDNE